MKTYKARFKEMNEYYLQRIRTLQDRLHAEKIAREQIDQMYQGYVVQLIKRYGLPDGTAFIEPKEVDLDTFILVEPLDDGRMCLRIAEKE